MMKSTVCLLAALRLGVTAAPRQDTDAPLNATWLVTLPPKSVAVLEVL